MKKTHTWDLVDLPRGKSVVGCKWAYKIKTKSDDTIERYTVLTLEREKHKEIENIFVLSILNKHIQLREYI